MSSYAMLTKSGKNFYHVASAFQKCVRRGMEHEALWYGTELYESNYEEYAWFRMRVMASEDVGLANPNLAVQIQALYTIFMDLKKKKNAHCPEKLQFTNALLLLIRSPKSRLVDNKLCHYFFLRHTMPEPEFPDFTFDMHTREGKALGRANDYFFEESAKITNENLALVPDEYEYRDKIWELYKIEDAIAARNKANGVKPAETPKAEDGLTTYRKKPEDIVSQTGPVTPTLFDNNKDE